MAMELEARRLMPGLPYLIHNTLPVAYLVLGVLLVLSLEFQISDCLAKPSSIQLVDNGYEGIVVALRDDVQESAELIKEIKTMFTDASIYLYNATRRRAYFRNVTILIPQTWNASWDTVSPQNYTYEAADIVVNPIESNLANLSTLPPPPHSKHFEGCGKQAAYIQFSSEFLTSNKTKEYYGNLGRLLVHEWGHFRWGLFNEYPDEQADQFIYNEFFYSSLRKEFRPTSCSAEWDSLNVVYDTEQGTYRECVGNSSVGFEDGCFSVPTRDQNRTTGSIMYGYTNIEELTQFCDNDTTEEGNLHVMGAPNKHNLICDMRSSWEVMREHTDFANNKNLPRNLTVTEVIPDIKIARVRQLRLVMVLDTSGSMGTIDRIVFGGGQRSSGITGDHKLKTLLTQYLKNYERIKKQAVSSMNFIMTTAIDGMRLGIVDFDSEGKNISGLVEIDSDQTRRTLSQKIPKAARGGTCIGCGLETALEILEEDGQTAEGGMVILITDGSDSNQQSREKTQEMLLTFSEKKVKIHSVAFSEGADSVVPDLASSTGGRFFLQTDAMGSTGLHDAFHATVDGQGLIQERPIQLYTESINGEESYGVLIDSTIGYETTFEFVQYIGNVDDTNVTLTSPSGNSINQSSPEYRKEREYGFVIIKINGTAEPGWWRFNFVGGDNATVEDKKNEVLVSVSSRQPPGGEGAIRATAVMNSAVTHISSGEQMILFSEVKRGSYPVLNCTVMATIERPALEAIQLQLFDNGAGADLTAGDGIYSRFFTQYSGNGFYGVQVSVSDEQGTAVILVEDEIGQSFSQAQPYVDPYQLLDGNLSRLENDLLRLPGIPLPTINVTKTPEFMRSTNGGSNRVSGIPKGDDFLAPCKIRDLAVFTSEYNESSVLLTFTAPGNDLDFGSASRYSIKSSWHMSPDSAVEVPDSAVLEGNLTQPQPYGTKEQFVIEVNLTQADENGVTNIYFTVNAHDEAGFDSDSSNVGQATFRTIIPKYVPLPQSTPTWPPPTQTSSVAIVTPSVTLTPIGTRSLQDYLLLFIAAGLGLFILIWILACCLANSRFVQTNVEPEIHDPCVSESNCTISITGEENLGDIDISIMIPLTDIGNGPAKGCTDGIVGNMVISPDIHDESTVEETQGSNSDGTSGSSTPPFIFPERARARFNPGFDESNIQGQYF